MTIFRAERAGGRAFRRWAAGLAASAAVVSGMPAWGQTPPAAFDPETMELAEPPIPGRTVAVEADILKAPSGESVGVLDRAHGGFPDTLWTGTPAVVARKLIPMLPGASGSLVVRDLERRLLLTAATAPEGAVESDRPSLVGLRMERLAAMGDSGGVVALAARAPQTVAGPLAQRARVEALLLDGKTPEACGQSQGLAGADGMAGKLRILCDFLAGRTLEGNLGLDLMREHKDADHAFIAAAEVVSGLPPAPIDKLTLDALTPLHVAAFGAAKLPLPPAAVAKAEPAVARAVAMSFATPFDVRLAAGERAEAAGVMAAQDVRKLYLEAVFAPDELAAPLARAETAGAHAYALLFRAASDQPDPLIRAHFIAKALDLAQGRGQVAATARVFAPLIEQARPEPALLTVAPAFARAHLALGHAEATQWLDLARTDPAAAKAVARLWPLAAVRAAAPGEAISVAGLAAWRDTLAGLPPEVTARRAAVVLGALAALGAKIPEAAWLDVLDMPASNGPNPALFALLQNAALEGRLGTTVLAALAGLGEQGLDKADSIALSEAISGLAVVGLGDDARKLAVEAMLANGV